MDEEKKTRLQIFFWDQFIRPVTTFFNIHQLQAFLLALSVISIFIFKSKGGFLICFVLLMIIYVMESIKYYRSGKYMDSYRKYKSKNKEYSDYRTTMKQIKKQKKEALNADTNIEEIDK